MQDENNQQKILTTLKQIQYQLQYTLADLHKCSLDINTLENLLLFNKDNKKAPR